MERVSLGFLVFSVSFIAGCASPPFTTPDVIDDFRGGKITLASNENEPSVSDVDRQCWMEDVRAYPKTLQGNIESAKDKLYKRSCTYAYYHDSVKAFKARSDQATLGFASVAAIGAATDSSTDFVKSMVALLGLSGATRIYVNPNVQMNVYVKSAIATQCMAEALQELEVVVSGQGIPTTRADGYSTIESVASGLNYIRYNPEIYPSLFSVSPSLGIEFVGLTTNPDQDAANKKAAIDFLFDASKLANKNLRLVHAYVESTLTAQAFNIENSVRVIPVTQTPKKDTGDQVGLASSDAYSVSVAFAGDNKPDKAKAFGEMSSAFSKLQDAISTDGTRPYADIIRINNDFSKCMTPIVGTSQ